MNWQWFYRLGSPKWFYEKMASWELWLGVLAVLLFVIGVVWGLGFAPADHYQGNSSRIMYVHVPSAIVSMAGYYVMAISGAIGMIWRMKLSFMVMKSAALIGAVLTFLALFTGSLWGKPTWGTYWEWDARMTSTLILLLLYLGVIALQSAYNNQDTADKTSAILALVGSVNIPIIYLSVKYWNTLHQGASITKGSIDASMAWPLVIMIFAYYFAFAWLLISHTRTEILRREKKTVWVQDLIKES